MIYGLRNWCRLVNLECCYGISLMVLLTIMVNIFYQFLERFQYFKCVDPPPSPSQTWVTHTNREFVLSECLPRLVPFSHLVSKENLWRVFSCVESSSDTCMFYHFVIGDEAYVHFFVTYLIKMILSHKRTFSLPFI